MLSPGKDALGHATYERHRPEQTLLYPLIEKNYPALIEQLGAQGKSLPLHVRQEFEAYIKCGRLEHGFQRVRCDTCQFARLLAFSYKKGGFCPSCGARRMAETAALRADEVFPDVPLRQWVISFPFPLRYLFAAHPQAMSKVLGIVYRAISNHLIHKAGLKRKEGATGAVTLIQRFGSSLEHLFPHPVSGWRLRLSRQPAPTASTRQSIGQMNKRRRAMAHGPGETPKKLRYARVGARFSSENRLFWYRLEV